MFKQNKYTKVYYSIIESANLRVLDGYSERHHIIPRCMGGTDDLNNIAILTAREHFICHRLLTKIVNDEYLDKMVYAAWQQSRPSKNKKVKVTSRVYEFLRKQLSESYTGRKRKPFSKQWRENMRKSAATRKKVPVTAERIAHLQKIASERDQSGSGNPFFGKTHSDEFKRRKAEHNRNRPKVQCQHCQQLFDVGMYSRWHGDKCKLKP